MPSRNRCRSNQQQTTKCLLEFSNDSDDDDVEKDERFKESEMDYLADGFSDDGEEEKEEVMYDLSEEDEKQEENKKKVNLLLLDLKRIFVVILP